MYTNQTVSKSNLYVNTKMKYNAFKLDVALDVLALIKSGRANSRAAPKAIVESLRKLHDLAVSEKGKGKYLGHYPRWSKTVLQDYTLDQQVFSDKNKRTKYRHEHVVPAMDVARILLNMSPKSSIDDVINVIDTYGIVAIITREEDSKLPKAMPKGWNSIDTRPENLYARYIAAGIYDQLSH